MFRFMFLILASGCASSASAQLVDITEDIGINHAHVQSQLFGGGIAVFDFDGDGFEDLFLTGGQEEDKLLLNDRSGGYNEISEVLPHNRFKSEITSGVTYADFNRDGCTDLFITSFNREENGILLQNDCNGGFKEVTNRAGMIENSASIGATVIDYDLDGDLDIYVINYIWQSQLITNEEGETIGFDHVCAPNFLYENEGNMRFREVAADLGVQGQGCALAVTSFNFINGDPAIYVANDFGEWIQPNELFIYDKESGKFNEVAAQYGLDYPLYGMGITVGDPDRDDDFDIYVSNLGQNAYLVNDGHNSFTEQSVSYGIDNTNTPDTSLAVSWGVVFQDFNNDLWQDLFVANGWIPAASFIGTSFMDPSKFYINIKGVFDDITDEFGVGFEYVNRGAAVTHIDYDGRPDLIVSGLNNSSDPDDESKYRFLKNEYNYENHFVALELKGVINNNEGFGAMVELYHGGEKEIQLSYPGGSYCSHHSRWIHFGLGDIEEIDSVKVIWPNGFTDKYEDLLVDQYHMLIEGGDKEILGCKDNDDEYFNPLATFNRGCKSDNSTSVTTSEQITEIELFPSLVHDEIYLRSPMNISDMVINVLDMTGRVVGIDRADLHGNAPVEILSNLSLQQGMYFISVHKGSTQMGIFKIIID